MCEASVRRQVVDTVTAREVCPRDVARKRAGDGGWRRTLQEPSAATVTVLTMVQTLLPGVER
jgi:hypothetical protein